MKQLFYLLAFLSIGLNACKRPSPDRQQVKITFPKSQLIGTWHLNEWDLYRILYIQDSTHIVIDNHIDTLFYYEYDLRHDTLVLMEKHEKIVNYNKILKLTSDSLVFGNFLDKEGIQRYSRKAKVE